MEQALSPFLIHHDNAMELYAALQEALAEAQAMHLHTGKKESIQRKMATNRLNEFYVRRLSKYIDRTQPKTQFIFGYLSVPYSCDPCTNKLIENKSYQTLRLTMPWDNAINFERFALAQGLRLIQDMRKLIIDAKVVLKDLQLRLELRKQVERLGYGGWKYVLLPTFYIDTAQQWDFLSREQKIKLIEILSVMSQCFTSDTVEKFSWLEKVYPELLKKTMSLYDLYNVSKNLVIEV